MHIHGDILDRYVERDLPSGHLAALDEHVSNCVFCADSLAGEAVVSAGWERRGWLGRLARIEVPGEEVPDDTVEERYAA